jgi:hypothetical protein
LDNGQSASWSDDAGERWSSLLIAGVASPIRMTVCTKSRRIVPSSQFRVLMNVAPPSD